jgi:hypothetical protein
MEKPPSTLQSMTVTGALFNQQTSGQQQMLKWYKDKLAAEWLGCI